MLKVKNILVLFTFLISVAANAQQGIVMKPLEMDSTQLEMERQLEYRQLISGSQEGSLFSEKIKLPGFDERYEFNKRYTLNLDIFAFESFPQMGFSTGATNTFFSPFYHNGMILSDAAYQMGDKFVLGGYSYGANSVFSAPFPNQGMNNYDTYGSTLFMQYKVSKKFKIETRVNVSQGNRPGF